jgi:transglutaminase-like putative cysteine protease
MEIAPGEPGIFQSLTAMRLAVLKERADPLVLAVARKVAAGCGPDELECKAAALYAYVRTSMVYTPDPEDVETVGTASYHLQNIVQRGVTAGDCDDAAVLLATLAAALELQVRFAVASFRPDRELHHVWAEIRTARGWNQLDTFRSERLNHEPTRVVYVEV